MIEGILFLPLIILDPMAILLPYSTKYFVDDNNIEFFYRSNVRFEVVLSGIISIFSFFGLAFGCFGKYLPNEVLNKNGDNILNKLRQNKQKNICTICLQRITTDNDINLLSCGHCYHRDCLSQWIHKNNVCPLCRHDIKL